MSYEPIRSRAANRPFYLNNDNELAVAPFTGSALSADFKFVLSKNPTLEGTVTLASGATLTLDSAYTPSAASDVATKAYVDNIATGLDVKKSVRAATVGANITLANTQTIDGVSLVAGNRVLVKDQTLPEENGIYVVVSGGAWTRSTDADNSPVGEVSSGMFTFVEEGTANADTGWILTTDGSITLGTTALSFSQFSSATAMSLANVGSGADIFRDQTGSVFNLRGINGVTNRISAVVNGDNIDIDIDAAYVGQTSITTLGTIGTGVWNATQLTASKVPNLENLNGTLTIAKGGTGQTTALAAFNALSPLTTAGDLLYHNGTNNVRLGVGAANTVLGVNAGGTAPEYKSVATGNAANITVTHGVGSITINTAQNLGTSATPTFGNVTIGSFDNAAGSATPKSYVDAAISAVATGLDFKQSVRAASTANLTLNDEQTIDGVAVVDGDRVLVKNQTTASENGIYIVVVGDDWTRATDADSDAEVTAGLFCFVEEGTLNADTGWVLSTNSTIVLDTTSLTFVQFSSAGVMTASNLGSGSQVFKAKVGNDFQFRSLLGTTNRLSATQNTDDITFDIDAAYVGQASITTLGTITTGTWSASTIAANKGGTGFSAYTVGDLLYADTTSTLAKRAIGTSNQVLVVSGGLPAWSSSLSLTDVTVSGNFINSSFSGTRLLVSNGSKQLVEHAALTTNAVVYAASANSFTSVSLTNGQLLIGSTGAAPAASTITGTAFQVLVSNGAGSITLSLPQNIDSGANPTFNDLTLSRRLSTYSVSTNIETKTADYSIDAYDYTILVDTTSGDVTITLPDASANSGRIINVKKIADVAGDVIVDTDGGNIDSVATFTIFGYNESGTFQSNGTDWFVL